MVLSRLIDVAVRHGALRKPMEFDFVLKATSMFAVLHLVVPPCSGLSQSLPLCFRSLLVKWVLGASPLKGH